MTGCLTGFAFFSVVQHIREMELEAAKAAGALEADLTPWEAWRPEQIAATLQGVRTPWYVAAGWAIDLFLGEERREHEDLEIAVPAARFGEIVDRLTGFELFVPDAGRTDGALVWPLARAPETLGQHHQTWVRDAAAGCWRLDIFREPADGETWICRRDARITLPYADVIERTNAGIPYARPEIVLLFKAKHARLKDEDDLTAVLPKLEPSRRNWLADALELVHPGHPWLERV